MRMVVDSNFLQNSELRQYLSKSKSHFAVLTDYAAMEAYKGNTLVSIYKSMAILSEFPKQVIILKGTQTVCGLHGRLSGLQRRLIDDRQTNEFHIYCKRLIGAENGDERFRAQLLGLGREATAQMDRVLADGEKIAEHIEVLAKTFTDDELRALRTGSAMPNGMAEKIFKNIMLVAGFLFRDHPRAKKLPPWNEAPNTFIFRLAICLYLWALRWISVGGARGAKPNTILNDMIDLNFAAYATFFDGLLTSDRKLSYLYKDAMRVYRVIFDPKRSGLARDGLNNVV
jgi:hypothetical protein